MQFRHFSNANGDLLQGDDCLTLCAKTSIASLGVIAALEWAHPLSALCAECTLSAMRCYERPHDCDPSFLNRPKAHSPPTRLAVILNCQKDRPQL